MNTNQVELAAESYRDLRDRVTNPAGTFSKAGIFHSSVRLECCKPVGKPSRSRPYSELLHARSATHVAQYYNVSRAELLEEAKRQDEMKKGE